MIKRTLYFGNPCYLRKQHNQLVIDFRSEEKENRQVPIEDVGLVLLDHPQITLTQGLMVALLSNNASIVSCDESHLPLGMLLPLVGHHAQTEKIRYQLDASQPLKKNLWQQTVQQKIRNQAAVLEKLGQPAENMRHWATHVRSGDPDNYESRAAYYYWKLVFPDDIPFDGRHRYGGPPNHLLNYGYSILRSLVARALVASGMLTTVGIFHRNKYNAYCLADDIMEPYRPYVDLLVLDIVDQFDDYEELTPELKRALLALPQVDVVIDDKNSPLMVGVQRTTASLVRCFEGVQRKISYPQLAANARTS